MYELAAKLATKAEKGQSYKTALYATKNKKVWSRLYITD